MECEVAEEREAWKRRLAGRAEIGVLRLGAWLGIQTWESESMSQRAIDSGQVADICR